LDQGGKPQTSTIVAILEALGDMGGSMIGENVETVGTLGTYIRRS
jgi:hypothetical protein